MNELSKKTLLVHGRALKAIMGSSVPAAPGYEFMVAQSQPFCPIDAIEIIRDDRVPENVDGPLALA